MEIPETKISFEAVIGLEVHAQLLTESKLFCGCSTKFGTDANANVCPVCLGHPGVLPVLNKRAVEFAVKMGLATNCKINNRSVFARKNYFYPDLPKGYQISQYEEPICEHGFVTIKHKNGTSKKIGITRIHLEEDAGKSIHDQDTDTLVDVNRCGVPLIEIVSEPDLRTPEEAYLYLTKIKQLVQYLGICDGNMEEGSLRCDANVSVRETGSKEFGVKREIKNLNSFRNVEKALEYELKNQTEMIEDNVPIKQETLLWNPDKGEAYSMRGKEEAQDYRYFPDPDLLDVEISEEWRTDILKSLPELPDKKFERFINDYSLPEYDASLLTQSIELADYYEKVTLVTKDYKNASNWIMVEVLGFINENKISISEFSVSPVNLGKLINLISNGTISSKIAKEVFAELAKSDADPEHFVKEKNLVQISDSGELEKIIEKILSANKDQVQEFIDGKEKVVGYFVGQIMKETKGKANPKLVNEMLISKLNSFK